MQKYQPLKTLLYGFVIIFSLPAIVYIISPYRQTECTYNPKEPQISYSISSVKLSLSDGLNTKLNFWGGYDLRVFHITKYAVDWKDFNYVTFKRRNKSSYGYLSINFDNNITEHIGIIKVDCWKNIKKTMAESAEGRKVKLIER